MAVRYALGRSSIAWIRKMLSRILLMEATERKVGQRLRVMLNMLAAGLATATSILTCFIDNYPNNPRNIDQRTIFLTCFQIVEPLTLRKNQIRLSSFLTTLFYAPSIESSVQ